MKLTFTGFCFLAALAAFVLGSWSCSKKQSDIEISIGTPTPVTSPVAAAVVTPNATNALSFAMPSPTVTPEPMEYEVEDIQGTVLALFDGEAGPETVEEGETLESGDSLITKSGSQATLSLNDVTAVHVSESTTVRIADLEPNASQGFISRLELTAGKVLSEVEKLDESQSTFEVESGGVICGVRGTAFEVQNQDGQVQTNTFHGAVEVAQGEQSQLVRGGEHSAFSFAKKAFLAKRKLNAAENRRYSAWGKIYKRARAKRAQRMEWIRNRSQTPEAQKFLQRRENWRQKRDQFRQANPEPARPAFENQAHPKPLMEREHPLTRREQRNELRRQGHPGQKLHPRQLDRPHERALRSAGQEHPGSRPHPLIRPGQPKAQGLQRRPNVEKNSVKPRAAFHPHPGLQKGQGKPPAAKPQPLPGKKNASKRRGKEKIQTPTLIMV